MYVLCIKVSKVANRFMSQDPFCSRDYREDWPNMHWQPCIELGEDYYNGGKFAIFGKNTV